MHIRLDPQHRQPVYTQIVQQIKLLVLTGKLQVGEQLPTVRQLATELQLNPNTVARAYNQLIAERVLAGQQGRGTYVYQLPAQTENRKNRRAHLQRQIETLLQEAAHWGCDPDELEKLWQERFALWRKKQDS